MTFDQIEKRLRRAEKNICRPRNFQIFADDDAAYEAGLCAGQAYAQEDGSVHVVLATTTTTTTSTSTSTTTTTSTTTITSTTTTTTIP